jgi:copper chaperone
MSNLQGTDLGLTDVNASCECCTPSEQAATSPVVTAESTEYLVEGMTCSHCVMSVTEELTAVEGVETVTVDLQAGGASRVSVATSAPVSDDAVRDAVEEAGYSLAGSR